MHVPHGGKCSEQFSHQQQKYLDFSTTLVRQSILYMRAYVVAVLIEKVIIMKFLKHYYKFEK